MIAYASSVEEAESLMKEDAYFDLVFSKSEYNIIEVKPNENSTIAHPMTESELLTQFIKDAEGNFKSLLKEIGEWEHE